MTLGVIVTINFKQCNLDSNGQDWKKTTQFNSGSFVFLFRRLWKIPSKSIYALMLLLLNLICNVYWIISKRHTFHSNFLEASLRWWKEEKKTKKKPTCSGRMILAKLIELVDQIILAEKFFPEEEHRLEIICKKWAKHPFLLLLRFQIKTWK